MPGFCMLGIDNNQAFMILKFRQASIHWEKGSLFNPLGPETQTAKNQVTLDQSFKKIYLNHNLL